LYISSLPSQEHPTLRDLLASRSRVGRHIEVRLDSLLTRRQAQLRQVLRLAFAPRLREEIGADERAVGEKDAIATHARLLSERRVGFLILAFGLALYLTRLVLRSSEGVVVMAGFALGMLALGLGATALWIKVGTKRVRQETHEAARSEDTEISEQ
jgi:hypothetical protein